jgi:AraC-like DNA-binding protein
MGLIAALVPAPGCRARLESAVHSAHTVRICEDWVVLTRACESEPVHLAVFDLYADGRTNFDRVRLLRLRFPRVALLAYVSLQAEQAREMFDLARCGVDDLVVAGIDDDPVSLRTHIDKAEARSAAAIVRPAVGQFPMVVRDAVLAAVTRAHERLTAETLARRLGVSRSDLTHALATAELPPPNQLITWGRLIVAAHLLEESDRSAEGVAGILDFASPGAFRNACRRYLGATPHEVRERGGPAYVTELLLSRGASGVVVESPEIAVPGVE